MPGIKFSRPVRFRIQYSKLTATETDYSYGTEVLTYLSSFSSCERQAISMWPRPASHSRFSSLGLQRAALNTHSSSHPASLEHCLEEHCMGIKARH